MAQVTLWLNVWLNAWLKDVLLKSKESEKLYGCMSSHPFAKCERGLELLQVRREPTLDELLAVASHIHAQASSRAQQLLATGYWLLVAGYWLLVTGYWLLVTGCWLP